MPIDPVAEHLDREAILSMMDETFRTIEWAVSMIPEDWAHRSPGGTRMSPEEGAWSAAMNLAHLALYSEAMPARVLGSLLDGGDGISNLSMREPNALERASIDLASLPIAEIVERLRAARNAEIELARSFSPAAWLAPATTAWGSNGYGPRLHSPARIVAKSVQHTWEHGNAILRVALFAPRELLPD